jgi:hypothetical protein
MDRLTHDDLYKKYLRQNIGPQTFPLIKILLATMTLFLFAFIVIINMFVLTQKNCSDGIVNIEPEKLPAPIVTLRRRPLN